MVVVEAPDKRGEEREREEEIISNSSSKARRGNRMGRMNTSRHNLGMEGRERESERERKRVEMKKRYRFGAPQERVSKR